MMYSCSFHVRVVGGGKFCHSGVFRGVFSEFDASEGAKCGFHIMIDAIS